MLQHVGAVRRKQGGVNATFFLKPALSINWLSVKMLVYAVSYT